MSDERYSMVQECTDSYVVDERDDGSIVITIQIPRRFGLLWRIKLSDLRTTDAEIKEHEPEA